MHFVIIRSYYSSSLIKVCEKLLITCNVILHFTGRKSMLRGLKGTEKIPRPFISNGIHYLLFTSEVEFIGNHQMHKVVCLLTCIVAKTNKPYAITYLRVGNECFPCQLRDVNGKHYLFIHSNALPNSK